MARDNSVASGEIMKPDCYKLLESEDPAADGRYVYDSSTRIFGLMDERTYSIEIEYDGQSSGITYFPERPGFKLVASDSPNSCERKERIVFGLVCMKLLLSGERWVQDI